VINHRRGNLRRTNHRCICVTAVAGSQQRIQLNRIAGLGLNRGNTYGAAFFHDKLFAACLDNCICHLFILSDGPNRYRKVDYYRHLTRKRQPATPHPAKAPASL
jgi:hypothetical protein